MNQVNYQLEFEGFVAYRPMSQNRPGIMRCHQSHGVLYVTSVVSLDGRLHTGMTCFLPAVLSTACPSVVGHTFKMVGAQRGDEDAAVLYSATIEALRKAAIPLPALVSFIIPDS
jgi:hypothetical protein